MSRHNSVYRSRVTVFIELTLSIGNVIVYLFISEQMLCIVFA